MRPRSLAEVVGQPQLLGPDKPLSRLVGAGRLHSAILWGPPGSGKTTLARLIAAGTGARFIALSAVMAGVKDVREAVAVAAADTSRRRCCSSTRCTASTKRFLPAYVETARSSIGATTENPSFALNNAIMARVM